jgi:hypothetical protein
MPQLPTLKRSTKLQATKPVQLQSSTPELKGANIAKKTSNVLGELSQIQTSERNHAENMIARELRTSLRNSRNELFTDFETVKGKDVLTESPKFLENYKKFTDEKLSELGTDRLRDIGKQLTDNETANFKTMVESYSNSEMFKYEKEEYHNYKNSVVNDSIKNSHTQYAQGSAVRVNINEFDEELAKRADRMGWGKETIEQERLSVTSSIHLGIISKAVSTGKYRWGQDYYDKVSALKTPEMSGQHAVSAQKILRSGMLLGETQRITDLALEKHSGPKKALAYAIKLAKAEKDPELRKAVEDNVMKEYNRKESIRSYNEKILFNNTYDRAMKHVEEGTASQFTWRPGEMETLDPSSQKAVFDLLKKAQAPPTGLTAKGRLQYQKLMSMPSTQLMNENPANWVHLPRTEYKEVLKRWQKVLDDGQLHIKNEDSFFNHLVTASGLDKDDEGDADGMMQLTTAWHKRLQLLSQEDRKNPEVLQKTVDYLMEDERWWDNFIPFGIVTDKKRWMLKPTDEGYAEQPSSIPKKLSTLDQKKLTWGAHNIDLGSKHGSRPNPVTFMGYHYTDDSGDEVIFDRFGNRVMGRTNLRRDRKPEDNFTPAKKNRDILSEVLSTPNRGERMTTKKAAGTTNSPTQRNYIYRSKPLR